jgi:hypothetical protein
MAQPQKTGARLFARGVLRFLPCAQPFQSIQNQPVLTLNLGLAGDEG